MPIVVSPSTAVGTTLVLDGLDLATGNYELTSFTAPIPAKRQEWIEGPDADGALLARDPLVSNGQAVAVIDMFAADKDAAHALIGAIVQKLEEADRNPTGIPLVWTASGATQSLTFYVLSGQVTDLPIDFKFDVANVPTVTITMDCRPGGYGAEITGPSATVTGPVASLDLSGILGDMDSDEARLVITEMSTQSRRHLEWALEQRYYNPGAPWSLVLDSDSLVTTGFAGAQTTQTGSYDPNATGNNIISATIGPQWQAIAGTGNQTHVGTFRIIARVYCTGTVGTTQIRFAWRAGDGSYVTNAPVSVLLQNQFTEIDLGLITIPPAVSGTQKWDGRVEAYSSTTGWTDTGKLDYIVTMPTERFGRVRAPYVFAPGVIGGQDSVVGTTAGNALNTRTAPVGGTWATSGDATDLTFADAYGYEWISRQVTLDTNGRYAILGSTTYTDQWVSAMLPVSGYWSGNLTQALVLRWTDANNHLRVVLTSGSATTYPVTASIEQVVAGTPTTLASVVVANTSAASPSGGGGYQRYGLRGVAFSSGRVIGQVLDATGTTVLKTLGGSSTAVATGGTLASGKGGIRDYMPGVGSGTNPIRYYGDITIGTPPAEPIALYSGRTLQVRSADVIRDDSTGTYVGRPPSYRGARFILPVAGTATRTTRVVVKAHRNDVTDSPADQIADQLTAQVFYRPRYSVVPY